MSNHRLEGGASNDTFLFERGAGDDTIGDFADGEDMIDLSAFSRLGFADLSISALRSDVSIDLPDHGGGTITL